MEQKEIEIGLDAEQELQKIKKIYDGELDFNVIKDNPILKPIAEINETFINLELMINKALIEYEEIQKEINEMVDANPVYSETILMSKIQALKTLTKQMIYSQDLQKTNMIDKINEMIRIVDEEYEIRADEEIMLEEKVGPKIEEKPIESKEKIESEEEVMKKLKKIVGSPDEEKEASEEKEVYSGLVERNIPKPIK